MNKLPLTKKQEEVLEFIDRFIANNGYSPTLDEVANYFKLRSPQNAGAYIYQLIKKGKLGRKGKGRWRNLYIK